MPDLVWFEDPLPWGLTRDAIEDWARAFGPRLLFHRHERHFPSTPESFLRNSRFRESRDGEHDRGWRRGSGWESVNSRGDEFYEVGWEVVEAESSHFSGDFVRVDPTIRPTLRPHDRRSLFRGTGRWRDGLFFERDRIPARSSSGFPPLGGVITAPVFLDAAPVETPDGSLLKVLFWFFYELNSWHGFLTHEGDWEHVTYVVEADRIEAREPPSHVYFAQHNAGEVRRWSYLHDSESGHPTLFVDPHGHPTRPRGRSPDDHGPRWDTWTQELRWIREAPWRDYSGAWGEVGETTHTTGPLGPWFKRNLDAVRVKRDKDGNLIVRIP